MEFSSSVEQLLYVADFGVKNHLTAEQVAELWATAAPAVSAYVRAEVRDRHDADDILQEIGTAVTLGAEKYDAGRPFTSWVFGIARNQILRFYRRQSKEKAVFSSELVEGLAETYAPLIPTLPARREALEECLKTLTAKQHEVIHMYYREEIPQIEIANRLHLTKSAVGVLMHRTRRALKNCISRRLGKETG